MVVLSATPSLLGEIAGVDSCSSAVTASGFATSGVTVAGIRIGAVFGSSVLATTGDVSVGGGFTAPRPQRKVAEIQWIPCSNSRPLTYA